jgi:hypothetical protein
MNAAEPHRVYLQFEDAKVHYIPCPSLDQAVDIYRGYQDEQRRQREGIKSCWVVKASGFQLVLGQPPANWSTEK